MTLGCCCEDEIERRKRMSNFLLFKMYLSSILELKELYYDSRNKVPPQCWKMLMRKSGLLDNDIEKIICDNAHHTDEQHYQMLKALQDRYGTGDALCKFLVGLRHMKLNHIYENLINELKSNDIITVETKD
ncbi:Tumor necrosis factor receptor superfamily member 1A [Varanus komodoensis]|nr:Tumor necrosis factor receptor superfamily member 1A [Varanus komodoensis]